VPQLQNYNPREDIFSSKVYLTQVWRNNTVAPADRPCSWQGAGTYTEVEREAPIRMTKVRKTENTKYQQGFGMAGIVIRDCQECKLLQALWEIM
jgi:hypothetical protein